MKNGEPLKAEICAEEGRAHCDGGNGVAECGDRYKNKKALVHSHAIPRLTFTSPHFERQTTVILPVATFLQKAKLGHFITSEVRVEGEEPPKIWLEFQTIIYLSHVRPLAGAPRHIVFMDLPRYHACLSYPVSSPSLKCPKRRNYAAICHSRKPNLQQRMTETSRRAEKPSKQLVTLFLEKVPPCSIRLER